jgi:hypothetical protein
MLGFALKAFVSILDPRRNRLKKEELAADSHNNGL